MLDKDKKEFGGWWLYLIALLAVTIILFAGLKYLGVIGNTIIEREVFEQSYQKTAADSKAYNTFRAQLVAIQAKLSGNLDETTRQDLKAQEAMLKIQLQGLK